MIGGDQTVEPDIVGMHVGMLYHLRGLDFKVIRTPCLASGRHAHSGHSSSW
jgi:hypothetical protein